MFEPLLDGEKGVFANWCLPLPACCMALDFLLLACTRTHALLALQVHLQPVQ